MVQGQTVTAPLNYMRDDEGDIWFYRSGPDSTPLSYENDVRDVAIHDARAEHLQASIDREGFELIPSTADVEFNADPEQVRASFYPAVERMVKEHLKAKRVYAFDHDFRSSSVDKQSEHFRPAVMGVHNDYTEISGPQRVRELLPKEADEFLKRRFAFINFWKAIGRPAEDTPLAVCDAKTVAPGDWTLIHLRYKDRTGQIYGTRFNPAQRWYYYPAMQPGEALLLKVYDSDKARSRFLPHTAFVNPAARKDVLPRQSIEVRTIAFF